jgi:mRNA interferase RelE/StbE
MRYQIDYSDEARRNLRTVPGNYRQRVRRVIESLADNPRPPQAKELRHNPNGYRISLGRWRLVYRVSDEEQLVFIAAIRQKRGPETYDDIQWN